MFYQKLLKNLSLSVAGVSVILVGGTKAAQAGVLTFDDVTTSNSYESIHNGYGGFNWDNFYAMHENYHPGSGYDRGTVSGEYTAFNGLGNMAVTSTENEVFNFDGAYLTGAWKDGLNIKVEGLLNNSLKYSETVVVDTDAPTWFNFDFSQIDSLRFSSSGGTYAGGFGTQFAMDNFTFDESQAVPESSSVFGLLALGAIGAGATLKRKFS